jgi:hypothetical protein
VGPCPGQGEYVCCRCRASIGRLGSLSSAGWVRLARPSSRVSPKKCFSPGFLDGYAGAVPVEVRLAQRRCPWGPACACDGGPAFQHRLLDLPCSVPLAERPLDKNAMGPALLSSLPSCRLHEVYIVTKFPELLGRCSLRKDFSLSGRN